MYIYIYIFIYINYLHIQINQKKKTTVILKTSYTKNMLEYRSDPIGNVLNLSKYSFFLSTYNFLYKYLNFVTTPKNIAKNNLIQTPKTSSVFKNSVPTSKMTMKHKRQTNCSNISKSRAKQNGHLKKRITPSKRS